MPSILENLMSDYSSEQLIRKKRVLISGALFEQNKGSTRGIRSGTSCI